MPRLLLQEDFDGLEAAITTQREAVDEALAHRNACRSDHGATDSPAFLEADQNHKACEQKLDKLLDLRRSAELITEVDTSQVSPGVRVTLRDLDKTGVESHYIIGGCRIFDTLDDGYTDGVRRISCEAPLTEFIQGAQPGERREGKVCQRSWHYEVVSIDSALLVLA